ncbi:MAG: beta-ketoacyl-[acyl-carrier-protein] synthase family protein [Deltaproteobacteria bacterium]|nr:beta-ketoacyl-[acyl-carrier-protein] synthase family protein [Deltaproteobacteria bacterium]
MSSVGTGVAALRDALFAGRDGIRPVRRFAIAGIDDMLAGLVIDDADQRGLSMRFGVQAAREAWTSAGVDRTALPASRIALVVGTSIGDDLHTPTPFEEITARIATELGIAGPCLTVSTACTSSTAAIGLALDLLASGAADIVIAGGTDVLTPEIYAGFHALGVLSTQKCAPFSEPFGTTLAEGAGFVVLERREQAERRGATPLAAFLGHGLAGDGYHETSPDPTGGGVARAIAGALAAAGIDPAAIGYVNAHGTGTEANDPAEWRALQRVFGEHAETLPVSSSKSLLGHAQGAAGVLELIVTILAMREQVLPQTLHFTRARARTPRDPVAVPRPRPATYDHAVCTNSAFGGSNAALVIGAPSVISRARSARRDVFVRGVGAVTSRDVRIEDLVPTASPRGLDPSARLLTTAAALALCDAQLRLRKSDSDRTGMIAAVSRVSPATASEFRTSIRERGLAQLSANAFARMVPNSIGGACSKVLGLRGPNSTLIGSGLVAIASAAELLACREDADHIVAGGVDEIDAEQPMAGETEGAACVVLGRSGSVRAAGWAIAGRDQLADAIARACSMAGVDRLEPLTPQRADAWTPAAVLVDATLAVRRTAHPVLVTSSTATATCAIVLTEVSRDH